MHLWEVKIIFVKNGLDYSDGSGQQLLKNPLEIHKTPSSPEALPKLWEYI